MVDDPNKQSDKDMWIFKEIFSALTTQPMLKIDTTICPSINKLTDEIELYRSYDTMAEGVSGGMTCALCDKSFKSPDSAVMHFFVDHQGCFINTPPLNLVSTESQLLTCRMCGYNTYAKTHYIAHLGHYHNKFKDSYETIKIEISGLPPLKEIFKHCNRMFQLMNQSIPKQTTISSPASTPRGVVQAAAITQALTPNPGNKVFHLNSPDVFVFSITGSKVSFSCMSCKMLSFTHDDMKNHLVRKHKMPIVLKCKDCGSRSFHQTLLNEPTLLKHVCTSTTNLTQTNVPSPRINIIQQQPPIKQPRLEQTELIELD